ncbi:MAG: sugar ABC transporter permease [Ruminococcaceae bacterium]|nr:sugar ABC transporter permease [Oscillospiraceae bacterium]
MTKDIKLAKPAAMPKKKKIASLDRRKARSGWIFVLPFILGFLIIYLPMVWESITISFTQVTTLTAQGETGYATEFVGFTNYKTALFSYKGGQGNQTFIQILVTGLGQMAFDVPAILIFSLFMAVMLNQKMAGRAAFRAIFFLPVILSTGIMQGIAAADITSEEMEGGIDDGSGRPEGEGEEDQLVSSMDLQMLFANMKVGAGMVEYIAEILNNIYDIVNRSGVQMLIFLAALQSISPAIYEACRIDGATSWETFWKITFPMISPMILVNGVYTIVDSFTTESNQIMSYISDAYSAAQGGSEVSTAMSWIYFIIVILIVAVIAGILSASVFYSRKND